LPWAMMSGVRCVRLSCFWSWGWALVKIDRVRI